MAQRGSRAGAANSTSLVLAIVAFVAVGGLIYWLDRTAEPTQIELSPEDTASAEPVSDVPIVDLLQVRNQLGEYEDLELEMREYSVNSLLGERGFWIGSQENPFLVMMDTAVASGTGEMASGDVVDVRGTIRAMSDSVLDAWEAEGAIEGEGERAVAQFSDFFLEANEVERLDEDGGDGDGGSADAGDADGGTSAD